MLQWIQLCILNQWYAMTHTIKRARNKAIMADTNIILSSSRRSQRLLRFILQDLLNSVSINDNPHKLLKAKFICKSQYSSQYRSFTLLCLILQIILTMWDVQKVEVCKYVL